MKASISHACVLLLLALTSLLIQPASLLAADADATTKANFDRLIAAIRASDRDAFTKDATDEIKQAFTPAVMTVVSRNLAPRLDKGFDATYLCPLKQQGHQVHLWKVAFKDGGDDVVLRVVMLGDKLAGFFMQ